MRVISDSHLTCRKSPSGLSASFLQSAARIICSPAVNKFHTCSLRSIFCQVHALAENVFTLFSACAENSAKLFLLSECESFLTRIFY